MKLVSIDFYAPGAMLQFRATPERAKIIIDFVLEQSLIAKTEVKAALEAEKHQLESNNGQLDTRAVS